MRIIKVNIPSDCSKFGIPKDGRLYAFWTMQCVSVSFLLDEL